MYYVDLPIKAGIESEDNSWEGIKTFETREEAIAFVQEHWGADENGNVSLVTNG